jgi:hypothetical protein
MGTIRRHGLIYARLARKFIGAGKLTAAGSC